MQWFARPRLSLYGPKLVQVGQPCQFELRLEASKPTTLDEVLIRLAGCYRVPAGKASYLRPFHVRQTFGGPRTLPIGSSSLPFPVQIPESMPGTYAGRFLVVVWSVTAHAVVRDWFDRVEVFTLNVQSGETTLAKNEPCVFVSDSEGPRDRAPYMEVTLGTTVVQPGDRLSLAIAFGNVEHNRYSDVQILLTAVERVGADESSVHLCEWSIAMDSPIQEGRTLERSIQMPDADWFAPAFEFAEIGLRWVLELRGRVAWGKDAVVWISITVARRALMDTKQVLARVGGERLDLVWSVVARATGSSYSDGRLRLTAGRSSIVVEPSVDDGRRVIQSTITFDDLGIGLSLGRRARRWLGSRTPSVLARDERQQELLRSKLDVFLAAAGAVSASDSTITCRLRSSGYRERPLIDFVSRVHDLALELERCRTQLPVPLALEPELPAWERAALTVEGVLAPAAPRITVDGLDSSMEIGIAWGIPEHHYVAFSAHRSIPERHRGSWAAAEPDAPTPAFAAELRSVLTIAAAVVVGDSTVRVDFVRDVSIERVAEAGLELKSWIEAITARGGPYR